MFGALLVHVRLDILGLSIAEHPEGVSGSNSYQKQQCGYSDPEAGQSRRGGNTEQLIRTLYRTGDTAQTYPNLDGILN